MSDALLYRKLATLIDDVPLAESLDDLRWRGAPHDTLDAWCESVGARHYATGRGSEPVRSVAETTAARALRALGTIVTS